MSSNDFDPFIVPESTFFWADLYTTKNFSNYFSDFLLE